MDKNMTNNQISAYTATLIHDLKTPILAQINALDLLLNGNFGTINEDQKEILEQIKESCEYAKNLVHSILDSYLYENGQFNVKTEIFDWNNLIENSINETSTLANNKNQKIILKSNIKEQNVYADKFQLKRVIVNLISNAVKYGFKNSTIEIETKQDRKNLIFNVKNQSNYINLSDSKKLFNKFQRDKRGDSEISCGLGLYLVKQIIKAHKGKVYGRCDKSGECNFGFSIPKKDY